MRYEPVEIEDDYYEEGIYEYLDTHSIDCYFIDYKVWRTLEGVDMLLKPYGLEIVYYSEDQEGPFSIQPIKNSS